MPALHVERLNKELKRRSKVIGIFPKEDSVLRLMGSEKHDAMLTGKSAFSQDSLSAPLQSEVPAKLTATAGGQQRLRST